MTNSQINYSIAHIFVIKGGVRIVRDSGSGRISYIEIRRYINLPELVELRKFAINTRVEEYESKFENCDIISNKYLF